jgi:hypothetical protein
VLIDKLSERFSSAPLIKTEIPEWGDNGDALTAYFSPWTLFDERAVRHFTADDNPEGFAAVVVSKLSDESGTRLFKAEDRKRIMRNCEAHTIKRVAMEIVGSTISIEDAAGN